LAWFEALVARLQPRPGHTLMWVPDAAVATMEQAGSTVCREEKE
jgi:hypothetical protein